MDSVDSPEFEEHISLVPIADVEQHRMTAEASNSSFVVIAEETFKGKKGAICVQKSPRTCETNHYKEVIICCAGNVDAGKSTILGSLVTGELDDGNGRTRQILMNYPHERETGRTSSIGHHILGFDAQNALINTQVMKGRSIDWTDVINANPTKVVSLVDLCGHESYFRTTIKAIAGENIDYAMVVVSASDGIMRMTKQHLALIIQFHIPFCIVLTKLDITPENVLKRTLKEIENFCRACRKIRYMINSYIDLVKVRKNESTLIRAVPIFQVSSVTGQSMDLLRTFIGLIPTFHPSIKSESDDKRARIFNRYTVKGIGTVVLCHILSGTFKVGDSIYLGPNRTVSGPGIDGRYMMSGIRSIQRKRLLVEEAFAGQTVTIALKKIKYDDIRIGMIMASKSSIEQDPGVWEFETNVRVISGHTVTMKKGYQPTVNIECVTQSCTVITIDNKDGSKAMGPNDVGTIRFRFKYRPEYIKEGTHLILRDGLLRAVGRVTKVIPITV
jgi:GTP-binding protein 1